MKFKKSIILIGFVLSIIIIIGYWAINHILPYAPIKPNKLQSLHIKNSPNSYTPYKFGFKYENLDFITNDKIKIKSYLLKANNPKATIILIHGIADNKESFYEFARKFIILNINVVLIDLRAHGQSEGIYCTFGYYEKYDIVKLMDNLDSLKIQKPYGIFGASLGGAIALQTLGIDKRLEFGIIESTFDRLDKVILEYSEDLLQFKSGYLSNYILTKSGKIANFKPFEVNPSEYCKNIDVPMFFSHGTIDDKIPFHFNKNNFKNVKSINKQFNLVKGASHLNLQTVGGEKYWKKIELFLGKFVIE